MDKFDPKTFLALSTAERRKILEDMERESDLEQKRLEALDQFISGISFWNKEGEWDHEEVERIAKADQEEEEASLAEELICPATPEK